MLHPEVLLAIVGSLWVVQAGVLGLIVTARQGMRELVRRASVFVSGSVWDVLPHSWCDTEEAQQLIHEKINAQAAVVLLFLGTLSILLAQVVDAIFPRWYVDTRTLGTWAIIAFVLGWAGWYAWTRLWAPRLRKIAWLTHLEQRVRDPNKLLDPMNTNNTRKYENLTWVALTHPIQELKTQLSANYPDLVTPSAGDHWITMHQQERNATAEWIRTWVADFARNLRHTFNTKIWREWHTQEIRQP